MVTRKRAELPVVYLVMPRGELRQTAMFDLATCEAHAAAQNQICNSFQQSAHPNSKISFYPIFQWFLNTDLSRPGFEMIWTNVHGIVGQTCFVPFKPSWMSVLNIYYLVHIHVVNFWKIVDFLSNHVLFSWKYWIQRWRIMHRLG